jgi:CHAT domain-containing protein
MISKNQCDQLVPLEIPAVDAALDWAWLVDLGQGNFTTARVASEQALAARKDATTLFTRAVVHQLQGEYTNAFPLFEEAFLASTNPKQQFIIASVAYLAARQRGDKVPDETSIIFDEVLLQHKLFPETEWEKRWLLLGEKFEKLEGNQECLPTKLEGQFIYYFANLPTPRSIVCGMEAKQCTQMLSDLHNQSTAFSGIAERLGASILIGTLNISWAELIALGDQRDEAFKLLEQLAEVYQKSNDLLWLARCRLVQGDLLASPRPLGHPVLLGYRLSPSSLTDSTTSADSQRFDRSIINVCRVRDLYLEAQHYFIKANAPRGEGMCLLRLAYLDVVVGNSKQSAQKYDEAIQKYDEACQCFEAVGDNLNCWIATTGELWAKVQRGDPEQDLTERAKTIALEMKQNDALAYGLSLGLALAYAGRDALATRGDVEVALRAANLAQTMFKVWVGDNGDQAISEAWQTPLLLRQAQICGDRADALESIEAIAASLSEREKSVQFFKEATEKQVADSLNIKLIGLQQLMRIIGLAVSQWDAERLERTWESAQDLLKDLPSLPSVKEKPFKGRINPFKYLLTATPQIISIALQSIRWLFSNLLQHYHLGTGSPNQDLLQSFSTFGSQFTLSVIHEFYRSLESEVAFYISFSYGMRAIEAGNDIDAEYEFTLALERIKGHLEENFRRALVFAGWQKYSEARAALNQYVAEGMPKVTDQFLPVLPRLSFLQPQLAETEILRSKIYKHLEACGLFVDCKAWLEAQQQLNEIEHLLGKPLSLTSLSTQSDILNYSYKGLVAEGLGDYQQAKQYLEEAIDALEFRRRYIQQEPLRRAFGSKRPVLGLYGDLVKVLISLDNWQEAFAVADKARARVLLETMGSAKQALHHFQDNPVFQRYTEQVSVVEKLTVLLNLTRCSPGKGKGNEEEQKRINNLEENLNNAIQQLIKCEADLFQAEPRWRDLVVPQTQTLSLEEVATKLPVGTLMIAYLFLGGWLFAWAVTCDGLVGQHRLNQFSGKKFISRPFGARLLEWVKGLNEGNINASFSALLFQSLIEPFDVQIDTAQHLLIVPFAELNMFPFGALPWRGKPLGLQKSISYLPSASLLQYFRDSDSTATEKLVVGNPEAMSYKLHTDAGSDVTVPLHPLPAARAGAQLVAQLYSVQPLIGAQATEETVRDEIKRYPRMIHFFTHGYLQPLVPLDSGIALAHGEALTVDELMGLGLRADIVFLSACNTGQGKLYGSELVSLARSILYAGARAVVVSLWEADDVANAMLMYLLHQKLLEGASLGDALRASQEQLHNSTAQQVLDFCQLAQSCISQEAESDRLDYAIFTQYIGNILAEGGDYSGALAKFDLALQSIVNLGYSEIAKSLSESKNYTRSKLLASRRRVTKFDPEKNIFDSPKYWAPFEILGDWR